jgi:RNA recognition motif-containing protein
MKSHLLMTNIPYNCSEHELQEWLESRGIGTTAIRIVRDLVSGASPAFGYVELKDHKAIGEAVTALNGKKMRNHTILVREAPIRLPSLNLALHKKLSS